MVPPCSVRISRVPPYSSLPIILPRTGLSPAQARLSMRFQSDFQEHWPGPRSLATTNGVSVDVLSSRYLDVSVPWVRFESPMYSGTQSFLVTIASPIRTPDHPDRPVSEYNCRKWVSPFGNLRIKARSQLPEAYRSVPRPSSPLSAKASTECP